MKPKFIVGIGGSAGGLSAYKALLGALPSDTGMAFVIVAHMRPDASSHLAEILSWYTKMNVVVASDGMTLLANQVYVNSPNSDIRVENGAFILSYPRASRNKEVDRFFKSLADAVGPRAITVILSGYDGDGTAGCNRIKSKGGTTFAQDKSAEVDSMPLSAQASGCVDFVLSPAKIADKLKKMASASSAKRSAGRGLVKRPISPPPRAERRMGMIVRRTK